MAKRIAGVSPWNPAKDKAAVEIPRVENSEQVEKHVADTGRADEEQVVVLCTIRLKTAATEIQVKVIVKKGKFFAAVFPDGVFTESWEEGELEKKALAYTVRAYKEYMKQQTEAAAATEVATVPEPNPAPAPEPIPIPAPSPAPEHSGGTLARALLEGSKMDNTQPPAQDPAQAQAPAPAPAPTPIPAQTPQQANAPQPQQPQQPPTPPVPPPPAPGTIPTAGQGQGQPQPQATGANVAATNQPPQNSRATHNNRVRNVAMYGIVIGAVFVLIMVCGLIAISAMRSHWSHTPQQAPTTAGATGGPKVTDANDSWPPPGADQSAGQQQGGAQQAATGSNQNQGGAQQQQPCYHPSLNPSEEGKGCGTEQGQQGQQAQQPAAIRPQAEPEVQQPATLQSPPPRASFEHACAIPDDVLHNGDVTLGGCLCKPHGTDQACSFWVANGDDEGHLFILQQSTAHNDLNQTARVFVGDIHCGDNRVRLMLEPNEGVTCKLHFPDPSTGTSKATTLHISYLVDETDPGESTLPNLPVK